MKFKTRLRRAEREDLDVIIEWMQDEDFVRFLYGDPARAPKQIRDQIVAMLGRSPNNLLPAALHLIIDHSERGPVGLTSLQKISWRNRSCTIDFYMGDKKLRRSIEAAAAMYRLMEYCFDELNLHRVQAHVYAFNTPMWRFLERVGAVRELTLNEHVFRDGAYHDMYSYGLLHREFDAFRQNESALQSMSLEQMIAGLRVQGLEAHVDS